MLIAIRTCPGRAELLSLTLWSVSRLMQREPAELHVYSDGPIGPDTRKAVQQAEGRAPRLRPLLHEAPAAGLEAHAARTVAEVSRAGHTWALWLSDDVVVAPDALLRLEWARDTQSEGVPLLVCGYRAEWMSPRPYRPHVDQADTASPLGLLNVALAATALEGYRPGLTRDPAGDAQAWDSRMLAWAQRERRPVLVLQRSVIQHLGLGGTHGWTSPPAADFGGFA